jgi:hypothetical protein
MQRGQAGQAGQVGQAGQAGACTTDGVVTRSPSQVVGRQRHADRKKLRAAGWCHGQGRHEGAGGKERGRHSGTASEPRLARDWADGQAGRRGSAGGRWVTSVRRSWLHEKRRETGGAAAAAFGGRGGSQKVPGLRGRLGHQRAVACSVYMVESIVTIAITTILIIINELQSAAVDSRLPARHRQQPAHPHAALPRRAGPGPFWRVVVGGGLCAANRGRSRLSALGVECECWRLSPIPRTSSRVSPSPTTAGAIPPPQGAPSARRLCTRYQTLRAPLGTAGRR